MYHRLPALFAVFLFTASCIFAQQTAPIILCEDWLTTWPLKINAPLFAEDKPTIKEMLETKYLDHEQLWPQDGDRATWSLGQDITWDARHGEQVEFEPTVYNMTTAAYAAAYLTTPQHQEISLTAESLHSLALFIDGELAATELTGENGTAELKVKRHLTTGKHLIVLKSLWIPGEETEPWTVRLWSGNMDVSFSSDPKFAPAHWSDYAHFGGASSPVLSYDGRYLAVIRSHRDEEYTSHRRLEIYDNQTAEVSHTVYTGRSISQVSFFPGSRKLIFYSDSKLWIYDLDTRDLSIAVDDLPGLHQYAIPRQGKLIYYSVDEPREEEDGNYNLIATLEDRISDWTDTRTLYVKSLENGSVQQLTVPGDFAVDEFALSQEDNILLITRRRSIPERPYYMTEFWAYYVVTGQAKKVSEQKITFETRPRNLTFLPGGNQVLYTSAAYLTDPETTDLRSLSETDIWRLDIEAGTAENLVGEAYGFTVVEENGALFFAGRDKIMFAHVQERGLRKIYRFDPLAEQPVFTEVGIPHPFVDQVSLSKMGRTLTYVASSPVVTPCVFVYDVRAKQEKLIVDPNEKLKPLLNLATFERWNFENSDGDLIDGWLFYPPGFTPQKSWPMVVYFYGGVGPRDEGFTFTYHWWAANGYLVYVVNPVGAVGYGQAFSDKHVNDWGTLASRDVIEGTEKLAAEKPFIDRNRLAAYGGSYGGFIAMDVITKTDLFAAAASMYGISNISSYFGGGIWGYTYGDIALAGSFPWNRKDVFVEKSPFFNADKVRTPLLLLHGTGDTNVSSYESDQMFVALKLLDRDVAYVQFRDEDHGIVNKFENYIEHRQMILEWFDKYCKDQPEGWEIRWKK